MLLFAGAGLDACAQQVVRDALPRLAAERPEARKALVGFGARKLRRQGETDTGQIDARFLAEALIGDPETTLIEALVDELTGSSMQSVEELKRVAAHLGLTSDSALMKKVNAVSEAFGVRNRISHDMDIKFTSHRGRNRKLRKRADMVKDANALLGVAEQLVRSADRELA